MSSDKRKEILEMVSKGELTPSEALTHIKRVSDRKTYRREDVAIIGVDAKLPGAKTVDAFWSNLRDGVDSVGKIPSDRWDTSSFYEEDPNACNGTKSYCDQGGFLDGIYNFDAHFFSISPKEATLMDPQERLLLQSAWHTLEQAGISREKLSDKYKDLGVYIGETTNSHLLLGPEQWERGNRVLPTTFPWSMANRISYFLDVNGPSMTIDTACSSSLVALYQAVKALRDGTIPLALVSGVNLYLHPSKYIWLSSMRMISPSGRSHSFGAKADGFCPGEGIVSILLKPAIKAEQDGDAILGIVKGCAINHDGKTTGYTVPNPQAQSKLITEALRDADLNPTDISLIEAHGTGTKLGDPIEISGLTQALSNSERQHFCAISSVKSNIGHLEAAAGLAGLLKIILQMKNKMKVPSLHCSPLNPSIDLTNSPLRIQDSIEVWEQIDKAPLRAGLSSFGAGGVNAHAVVEQYCGKSAVHPPRQSEIELFVLSAQSEEALRSLIISYREIITHCSTELYDLCAQIAHERSQLSLRVAFLVSSKEELLSKLDQLLPENELQNYLRANKNIPSPLKPVSEDSYLRLQYTYDRWRRGEKILFNPLYPTPYIRTALPLYPFKKTEYRLSEKAKPQPGKIHPLLGCNRSTLDSVSFTTTFTGDEYFLAEHIIGTGKVLPGVAYLEMALQAIYQVTGEWYNRFNNIVWSTPYRFSNEENTLVIELSGRKEEIHFSVNSPNGKREYARGRCSIKSDCIEQSPLKKLPAQIVYSHNHIYSLFESLNLHYGDAFRGIKEIQCLDSTVHAKISLHSRELTEARQYQLHPGLLDSILQSSLPFSRERGTMLPFAIDELVLHKPLTSNVSVETQKQVDQPTTLSVDISAFSSSNVPLLTIKGFTLKSSDTAVKDISPTAIEYICPQWNSVEIEKSSIDTTLFRLEPNKKIHPGGEELVFKTIADLEESLKKFHHNSNSSATIICQLPGHHSINDRYQWLLSLVQTIQSTATAPRQLLLYSDSASPQFSMCAGFLKCAVEETSNLTTSLLEFHDITAEEQENILSREASRFYKFREIRYTPQGRQQKEYTLHTPKIEPSPDFSSKSILITGGLGALGSSFAKHFLTKLQAHKVILLGRSALSHVKEKLKNISQDPQRCIYIQGDIRQTDILSALISEHNVQGVVHAAGINKDSLISQKEVFSSKEESRSVFNPKVNGTLQLVASMQKEPIEFLLLCSSIAAVTGNAGQSDYAMANSFMDAIASESGKKRIISINWPLWRDGGMQVDQAKERFFEDQWGMQALDTERGLEALLYACTTSVKQLLPFQGNYRKLLDRLNNPEKIEMQSQPQAQHTSLYEIHREDVQKLLAEITGYDRSEIRKETTLDDLGFDSLMITDLSNKIGKMYSLSLSAALFFEFTTAEQICSHLLTKHAKELSDFYGISDVPKAENAPKEIAVPTSMPREDIAIIGMSGTLPGSESLDSFWEQICEGRSAISEVPQWRWDSETYRKKGVPQLGGFIPDIECFDPLFFGISPAEAKVMDPQHRLCMQSIWKTIEDSGYKPSALSGSKTGLYIGVSVNDYAEIMEKESAHVQANTAIGSVHSMLVNRVSYFLNLKGPSEPIDTACSSSLVALHRAVQDLYLGNAEMAIVGGVNTLISPKLFESFHKAGMLSPDGHCFTCDEKANGYVRAEGVGSIMIKPLSKALADGDAIYAAIKGTGVNHGGRANSLTAPNPKAQRDLLIETYNSANIPFETVDYIELHGTGTPLGDPIELHALQTAGESLSRQGASQKNCFLGSVKTTIGHMESAAGIAGIIKLLLAMKYKTIPPMAQFTNLNPEITLEGSPFKIPQSSQPWINQGLYPRRAGVSSFGFGGVNAHVILDEFPQQISSSKPTEEELLVFSAKTKTSLREQLRSYYRFFKEHCNPSHKRDEQKQSLMREILASVLHLPYEETPLSVSPLDLGIDVVTGATLVKECNRRLKTDFTLEQLLQTSSLQSLLTHCSELPHEKLPPLCLKEIAYTLQTGREEFRFRYAITARCIETAQQKLALLFQKSDEDILEALYDSENPLPLQESVQSLKRWQKSAKAQILWLRGKKVEWFSIYDYSNISRVHLPTYEFDKKQLWFDDRFETVCSEIPRGTNSLTTMEIVASTLSIDISTLSENTELATIGVDSITILQIADELQKHQGIAFPITKLSQLDTIGDVIRECNSLTTSLDTPNEKKNRPEKQQELNYFTNLYKERFHNLNDYHIKIVYTNEDKKIEYITAGQGVPIFMLNGLGMTFAAISNIIQTFSSTHKVIAFNYPGIGNSETTANFCYEYIASIIDAITDVHSIKTFHLLGWSMGGFIAQQYAVQHPQKLLSLTLLNTAPYLNISFTPQSIHSLLQKVTHSFEREVTSFSPLNNEEYDSVLKGSLDYKQTMNSLDFIANFNKQKKVFSIQIPTLLIAGSLDPITPSSYSLEIVKELNNNNIRNQMQIYDGCEHFIPMFKTKELFKDFQRFNRDILLKESTKEKLVKSLSPALNSEIEGKKVLNAFIKESLKELLNPEKHSNTLFEPQRVEIHDAMLHITHKQIPYEHISSFPSEKRAFFNVMSKKFPSLSGHLQLLEQCITNLPEILSGIKNGTEVLFPNGDVDLVKNIYNDNIVSHSLNLATARSVLSKVNRCKRDKVKILEIGAGTGSTTKYILPTLIDHNVEYHFTDISRQFITSAEKEFQLYNFMKFYTFDIEHRDTNNNCFDIIIASNVLHATKDIAVTLRSVKDLLKKGGVLILNELTEFDPFTTITFGLLDGWWLSRDSEKRIKHSPLLTNNQWKRALENAGFQSIIIESNGKLSSQISSASVFSAQN